MSEARRKLGIMLCLALAVSLLGLAVGAYAGDTSVAHAQATTVEVEDAALFVGESGSVDIWVRGFPAVPPDLFGLGAYAIQIDYDPAAIEITGISPGDPPFDEPVFKTDTDWIRITQFSAQVPGPTGDIRIADIEFTCLDEGVTDLVLTIIDLANTNGDDIVAAAVDGTITQTMPVVTVSIDAPPEVPHCTEFVARANDVSNELRIPVGHPTEDEEGGTYLVSVEELQDLVGVSDDPTLIVVPAVPADHVADPLNLIVVFHVDGEGVQQFHSA